MDREEHLAPNTDMLSTTATEAQCNLPIPAVKTDIKEEPKVESFEEDPPCTNDMYPSESLGSSKYENYYANEDLALEPSIKEYPEDEHPLPDSSVNSKLLSENTESLKPIDKEEIKIENADAGVPLHLNEENDDSTYRFTIKMELSEKEEIINSAEDTSTHYNTLVTPQEVQCKLCSRTFENSYSLLTHSNEHIKIEVNPAGYNVQYKNITDVPSNETANAVPPSKDHISAKNLKNQASRSKKTKNPLKRVSSDSVKCKYCNAGFINRYKMYKHMTQCRSGKDVVDYNCESCGSEFMSERGLRIHIKRIHRKAYHDCWCGREFCSSDHLSEHMMLQHGRDIQTKKDYKLQCDMCKKYFKAKNCLILHIKRVHSGKLYQCSCGKKLRTPRFMSGVKMTLRDEGSLKNDKFRCYSCQKIFKTMHDLREHKKIVHYLCNKAFSCWCGKQFQTVKLLQRHKMRHPDGNINNKKFQCDSCHKVYKTQCNLDEHIKGMHFDYGRTFDCWCGKQFRTPIHLRNHNIRHLGNVESSNVKRFQCDLCKKFFKNKQCLSVHIKTIHDYGKVFQCWCGEKFHSTESLDAHNILRHTSEMASESNGVHKCECCGLIFTCGQTLEDHMLNAHYDQVRMFKCWCGELFRSPVDLIQHKTRLHDGYIGTNYAKFQCDICEKFFKHKRILIEHIRTIHFNYGKIFKCQCGKEFRTPRHLREHRNRSHCLNVNATNEVFQCGTCQKVFKSKRSLSEHTKSVHYDYGQTFGCWCGKQYRTPKLLHNHRTRHCDKKNTVSNEVFQCEYCEKYLKTKRILVRHIQDVHYDYGRTFECWCGKEFRTPALLRYHKRRHLERQMKEIDKIKSTESVAETV